MSLILDKIDQMVAKFPDKILFADEKNSITTTLFQTKCKSLASKIAKLGIFKQPIAVIDSRNVETLIGMFGTIYSGNFYLVLDGTSPEERLNKICQTAEPAVIVCQSSTEELAKSLAAGLNCQILNVDGLDDEIDEKRLLSLRQNIVPTDIVYLLFTSGSTGVPKGTVINHVNLLTYVEWFASTFEINEKTIFASQTPFYFSASVSDLYSSLFYGATFNIIPRSYFSFPIQLVHFMNERKVNTIYWVPSALCIVANVKLFDYEKPKYLEKVMFAGEIMPNKQLNYWRRALPDVKFANLFGPTETTDICTYYKVDRPFKDDEPLPIGRHCENLSTFIIDENGKEVARTGVQGELYVRGPFVAQGYYKNEEQTKKAFVQNPLQSNYPETVYKTGDLVMLNEYGEYEYIGRSDYQIKHKGYRIELGEIERVAGALEKINTIAAIFDKDEDRIVVIYSGKMKEDEFYKKLTTLLPSYMVPERVIKLAVLPLSANGKIDRKFLQLNYKSYMEEK